MLIGNFRFFALTTVFIMYGAPSLLAEDKPVQKVAIKEGVPEGFEVYGGPQETVVDMYYGGTKLGGFRAIYTPTSIAFAAPDDIVNKIPAVKHEMTANMQKALTGELPTKAEAICGHIPEQGCGVLKPEVAAVIFYEDKFRADLFINPDMLAEQDTHTDKILPPAPEVLSAIHSFNGGFAGTTSAPQNYSLLTNSTIAYGAAHMNVVGLATNTQKQINTMSVSLDKWGLESKAGFFDSHPLQLLPQTRMSGVSVGTSLNTNLALRDTAGSRISVFLPQRAWVSLIYNSVIYTTDFYEAGNQILNTDSLPQGAYQVTIRIRDTAGGETEENRFFAKNFEIPPVDQSIYFWQAGTIRDATQTGNFPNVGVGLIASAGTTQRLDDNVGVATNFLVLKNTVYNESGMFLLLPPDHQLRFTTLIGSSKDYGFGASYLGYTLDKKIALSTDLRTIFVGPPTAIPDPVDPITASSKQLSSGASYQITELANIGIQGGYTKSGAKTQYVYGPTLHYDFWREGESNLALAMDSSKTQDGIVHSVFLRFAKRLGSWGYSSEGNVRQGDKKSLGGVTSSKAGGGRITWNNDKDPGSLTTIGAEAHHDDLSDNYIADLDHRGSLGNIRMTGSQTRNAQVASNFYSGNIGFGIAQTTDDISWGGNQQQASGVIVKSTGNSDNIPMDIMVGSSKNSRFNTGNSVALFIPPYQTYDVSIKPVQSAAIDYDGAVKRVTLYPGNIVTMNWDINRIFVVLGRVQLPDGTPLANAKLEESRNITVTDEEGMFQAELLDLKKITFKRAAEEPSPINNAISNRQGNIADLLTILSPTRPKQSRASNMSTIDQNNALLDLYGHQNRSLSEQNSTAVITSPASTITTQPNQITASESSIEKPRTAIRCQVELPEAKEMNSVYIYSQPLICIPIAPEEIKEEEKKVGQAEEDAPRTDALQNIATSNADATEDPTSQLVLVPDVPEIPTEAKIGTIISPSLPTALPEE